MSSRQKSSNPSGEGVAKPKQSKSRNGCVTCKAKRLKCDERKPACQQCERRQVHCGGYQKEYKWRPFEESSFTNKSSGQPRSKRGSLSTSSDLTNISPEHEVPEKLITDLSSAPSYVSPSQSMQLSPEGSVTGESSIASASPASESGFDSPISSLSNRLGRIPSSLNCERELQAGFRDNGMQELARFTILPGAKSASGQLFDQQLGAKSFQTGVSVRPGSRKGLISIQHQMLNGQNPEMSINGPEASFMGSGKIGELTTGGEGMIVCESSLQNWGLTMVPGSAQSASPFGPILQKPMPDEWTPKMLVKYYNESVCGILSVRDGPSENPWRTMVLAMAKESPALYHAISSIAAFHLSRSFPELKVRGVEYMHHSMRDLANGIGDMRLDTALATTLVLAFASTWDVHVSTGIEHVRGAKALVKEALMMADRKRLRLEEMQRVEFLSKSWVYIDVLSRLTCAHADEENVEDKALWDKISQLAPIDEIDPLMGCASTLFPIIGRVANLVRKVWDTPRDSVDLILRATRLKAALEGWTPPNRVNSPEDPTCEVIHALQTAEAYRYATLLYLHQAFPEIPSQTTRELARRTMVCLDGVPLSSRTVVTHIYPLMVGGCEAYSPEDRVWVRHRWASMSKRLHIGSVDRCMEIVDEVWNMRDKAEGIDSISCHKIWSQHEPSAAVGASREIERDLGHGHNGSSEEWNQLAASQVGLQAAGRKSSSGPGASRAGGGSHRSGQSQNASKRRCKTESSSEDCQFPPHPMASMSIPAAFGGDGAPEWTRSSAAADGVLEAFSNGHGVNGLHRQRPQYSFPDIIEILPPESTVSGKYHWIGVMRKWGWEVLLG